MTALTNTSKLLSFPQYTVSYGLNHNLKIISQCYWSSINAVAFYNSAPADLYDGGPYVVAVWRVKSL